MFDGFAPESVLWQPKTRTEWATNQLKLAAKASRNLGIDVLLLSLVHWRGFMYPWPQRPAGLVEDAFEELANRWKPILDTFDENGVDVCYEIHPGEDLDGITWEMFREAA